MEETKQSRYDQVILSVTLCLLAFQWIVSNFMRLLDKEFYHIEGLHWITRLYYSKPILYLIVLLLYGWPILLATRVRVPWLRWTIIGVCAVSILWFVGDEIREFFVDPKPFIYYQF